MSGFYSLSQYFFVCIINHHAKKPANENRLKNTEYAFVMALVFIILVPDCDKLSAKKHTMAKNACQHIFLLYVCDIYFIISLEGKR